MRLRRPQESGAETPVASGRARQSGFGEARSRGVILTVLMVLTALLTTWSWALASPAGASPDDDFHMASIWCALGDRPDLCGDASAADEREVARDLVADATCYAFDPTKSAACQGGDFGEAPSDTIVTDRGNFDGLYPPLFYLSMAPFASADIPSAILTMRFVNGAFIVASMSLLFVLLPRSRRALVVVPVSVATVPLGLFLFGSVNPSSWAILSAAMLWVALLAYFETSGRRRVGLAVMAVYALIVGAGARADSAAYSGIAIVVVLILKARNSREFYARAALPVAMFGLALVLYRWGSQTNAASEGLGGGPSDTIDKSALALSNFINVPELWIGALGRDSLGWLDTLMPGAVWVAVSACYLGLFFLGIAVESMRKFLAIGLVVSALWLLPTVLLTQSGASVGTLVQSRYLIPLMVLLLGVALSGREGGIGAFRISRLQALLLVGGLASANSLALHTNIRRYVTGVDRGGLNLNSGMEWWWAIAPSPMVVWIAGSIVYAALLVIVFMRYTDTISTRRAEETTAKRG